jgi:outer membrane protein
MTLRLEFPIFEGGLRRAEVREALARERQTRLALGDLRRQISVEVESAWLDLRTQQSALESLRDQLRFARENFEAISKQFRFGLSDSLDVMDANTLLVTAERQLSEARFRYQLARIRLSRATGTLLGEIRAMLGKSGPNP